MMTHPYSNKRDPYYPKAVTGTACADSRYGPLKTPDLRTGPLIADAENVAMPEDRCLGAPARQVYESGKVRK